MEKLINWSEIFFESLKSFGENIMSYLPNILGAILLLILGWLISKLISFFTNKALKVIKFDSFADKTNTSEILAKFKIKISPSKIISKFVYWVVLLVFFVTATETLGWTVVSQEITLLITYLPNLFAAILIFIVGFYIANFVKKLIDGTLSSFELSSGKLLSEIAFYVIIIIVTLTAIKQAGVNTDIISSNITIILGILFLTFAIAFSISSKEVLTNILAGFYSKHNFEVGQYIIIDDVKGEILQIDKIHVILKTKKSRIVLPLKKLINEKVEIIDK
ncbi:MAG: hypothetical protein U9R42_02280 [Bacteroidota bacterium]|nr:hypothetical protein [Bacteroidota bacterium]